MKKGLILAAVQLVLAMSVVGKFAYDRETLPREWRKAEPYDPYIPLRGRYVQLRMRGADGLVQAVPFFIAEGVPDPSIRKPGEELWVEVSVPKKGPPRPDPARGEEGWSVHAVGAAIADFCSANIWRCLISRRIPNRKTTAPRAMSRSPPVPAPMSK